MRIAAPLIMIAAGLIAGCDLKSDIEIDENPNPIEDSALLRVAHMSPDTPNVDILIDSGDVDAFYGNGFGTGTDYAVLAPGTYNLDVIYNGGDVDNSDDIVLSADAIGLDVDTYNTAVLLGTMGGDDLMLLPVKEERSEPEAGKYRLHIVHAAPGEDFRVIDIWDVSDEDPVMLADDAELGEVIALDLDASERDICLDIDDDASCDALFPLPLLSAAGFYNLYITNNNQGTPFSMLHFENGTTAYINTESQPL